MDKIKGFFKKIGNFFKNNKKKVIIGAIALIVIFVFVLPKFGKSDKYTQISNAETISLSKGDFVSSVSESGKIKSEDSVEIYPEKQLPISEINVKVGDVVQEGDVIAKLDDSSIRQQIAQTQATIGATNKSAGAQIESAKSQLEDAKRNREDGTNSSVVGANSSLVASYDAWQNAEKTYQDYKKSLEERYNDALIAAETSEETVSSSVESAELNLTQAEEELRENRDTARKNREWARSEQNKIDDLDREIRNIPTTNIETNNQQVGSLETDVNPELNQLKTELSEAKANLAKYEAAAEAAENSMSSYERKVEQMDLALKTARGNEETNKKKDEKNEKTRQDQLETYRKAAESAKSAYDTALESFNATRVGADDQISALENSLKIAQTSGDTSINQVNLKYLYEDLGKTVIKAPMSGTVTEDNMEKGQVATGSICTIETVDDQIIESSVKEFDLNNVKVGMKVVVTSDALGKSKPFEGRVVSIDPVPAKKEMSASGSSTASSSNDVVYKTKIKLDKHSDELKPGMSIRAKYILEEQKNVYTVPTTAIYEKNGKSFVLAASNNKKGTKLKELEVKTGLANDVETVIISENLKDKMVIITSPENYSNGMEVEFIEDMGSEV